MNSLVILVLSCFFTANLALDQSGQPEVWPEGWPEGDHQQWYPDIHKPVKPTNSRPPNCQSKPDHLACFNFRSCVQN